MKKITKGIQKAQHGEKMIEIQIRFWTDGIAKGKDKIAPKNCWSMGVVKIQTNNAHGIKASNPMPFNSLLDMSSVIEKVLIQNQITMHKSNKMKKYID